MLEENPENKKKALEIEEVALEIGEESILIKLEKLSSIGFNAYVRTVRKYLNEKEYENIVKGIG